MSTETFRREWLRVRARHLIAASAVVTLPLLGSLASAATVDGLEEVIVTGSSLKGVAPVGSNLTTVGRDEVERTGAQTVQQILKTVPAVVGLQSAGQGGYGSFDGAGTNAPTIHGLGASASNSTLVLLNGHRLPVSGLNHVLADPNIVAPLALERVEVLADGASSVYGSDAVAGVINFITRRNFDGLEATAQKGFADGYGTFNAGALWGHTWDSGNFLLSYNFSDRDNLAAADRDYTKANQTARGGRNFTPNRCSPASVTVGSSTYYTPYSAAGVVGGDCDPSKYWDLLPAERRQSVFASLRQDVNDKLRVTADVIYSSRTNTANVTRGSATGKLWSAGSTPTTGQSINPFANPFSTLPGAPTSATVNFNADQLLGSGATITGKAETFYSRLDGVYQLGGSWDLNVGGLVGRDRATQVNQGQLNASVFNLALNGYTSASINGVTQSVSQVLTTANAIDVFGTGTSAATKALLADNRQTQIGDQTIVNYYAKASGDLFDMPAGAAKLAVGAEFIDYKLAQDNIRANNLGPASLASQALHIDYNRDVKSAYAELYLPLVKDGFVRNLEATLSGRTDDYSDFGRTSNPKFAVNMEVIQGLKLRANWAKSFVAPALTSRGANAYGLTGESGFSGINGGGIPGGSPTISIASFPSVVNIPGAVCTATSCTISNVNGVLVTGGNGSMKPQTGKAYSFGVDLAPVFAPGLNLSVTYWNNELRGGITAPVGSLALGSADLAYLLQLYPTGMTPAQVASTGAGLPQTGAINSNVYFSYNYQQRNVLNLNVAGLDVSASYRFDTDFGKFNVGAAATRKLKFDQFIGANGTVFSLLGTAGFNTTFPSVKTEARANLGFEQGAFSADLFMNYLGGYKNWSGSVANAVVRTNGVPTSGGDSVSAFTTYDLHVAYDFGQVGSLTKTQVFVDANNLFDKDPPQYNAFNTNGSAGYDNINANPLGRVITVGVRAKF